MGAQQSKSKKNKSAGNASTTSLPAGEPMISDEERQLLYSNLPIVAIFGQSGTGKSTFINLIAEKKQAVGESIDSCTDKVTLIKATIKGRPVIVVDSPGIDDTRPGVTEADVLANIANSLAITGRYKRWVTGVLFLHRISDPRFGPTAARIARMLNKLCGETEMRRVMFCTTMWDLPLAEESEKRHAQLCNTPVLKGMISEGARTAKHSSRWDNSQKNAENIVSELIKGLKPGPLAIQDEMLKHGRLPAETSAGQVVVEHIGEQRIRRDAEMEAIRRRMSKKDAAKLAELEAELADTEKAMVELERQRRKLLSRESGGCIIC